MEKTSQDQSEIMDIILEKKVAFVTTFFIVFLISYAVLAWFDFLPEPISSDQINKDDSVEESGLSGFTVNDAGVSEVDVIEDTSTPIVSTIQNVKPEKIIFDTLDKTIQVANPTSRSVHDLDNALLDGAVRHPDSATLDQNGTVFILGHSSYLPVVNNKNFKAFNGIQNLKWGDVVRLQSGQDEYVYKVNKVYKAYAANASVPIAGETQKLVLATCNSFGSVDDRFIIEAELSEVRAL
ncbi:MAG: sortase [Candidatus Nomurabacteria bacterium]|nr:MAG: sortase [Candidatus Nomurabacteria bacterium]